MNQDPFRHTNIYTMMKIPVEYPTWPDWGSEPNEDEEDLEFFLLEEEFLTEEEMNIE